MRHVHYPNYPNQEDMEIPLLKAIVKRGGWIWFSLDGDEIEHELADEFNLTEADRDYTSPEIKAKGHRKWRNHIQYVRLKLVDKGYMDKSVKDEWRVTPLGFSRIGATPPENN